MGKKLKERQYKQGDLVRVHRNKEWPHSLKSGRVMVVVQMGGWAGCVPGMVLLEGRLGRDGRQSVYLSQVKPAKQATRKQNEYASRRG